MAFELPKLPYGESDLHPVISSQTIGFHYGKHHQAYVDNLNRLTVGTKFENADLITVVKESRRFRVAKEQLSDQEEAQVLDRQPLEGVARALLGVGQAEAPFRFRALVAAVRFDGDELVLSPSTKKLLKLKTSAPLWAVRI